MTPLFSINGAAEVLERDRRTITKALRRVEADGRQGGQSRWRLKTIIEALTAMQPMPAAGCIGSNSSDNPPEYARFDRAYDAMKALPTLSARRAAALKTVPLLISMITALRVRGREVGEDAEVTALRADRVYQLALIGFRGPCHWNHDQVWEHLNIDTDADAV